MIADWIDADTQPINGGAEDSVYAAQTPPYRAANTFITSPSELLALPGVRARPVREAGALRDGAAARANINVCSASGVLLDAMVGDPRTRISATGPTVLPSSAKPAASRPWTCTLQEFGGRLRGLGRR